MPDKPATDRLAEIMQAFTGALPGKIGEITRQWKLYERSRDARELNEVCSLCHSLAGTAGTFDHAAIGDIARQVEVIIRQRLKQGETVSEEDEQEIRALLGSLDEGAKALGAG